MALFFRRKRANPMARARRVVVGLGNPGPEYEGTRHNVGFAVVDRLAEQTGARFASEKGLYLLAWASHRNCAFGLAKPLTYMNRSGLAVKALLQRYRLQPTEILVVVDDIHLPVGVIRLREKGGAGGHNGLASIIEALGTDRFPRLRIGIGSHFERGRQAEYVLSPFEPEELPLIEDAIERAAEAALLFACEGLRVAMNRYRPRPEKQPTTEGR